MRVYWKYETNASKCSGCRTITRELVTLAYFSVCLRRSLVTRVLERGECLCGWPSDAYTSSMLASDSCISMPMNRVNKIKCVFVLKLYYFFYRRFHDKVFRGCFEILYSWYNIYLKRFNFRNLRDVTLINPNWIDTLKNTLLVF